MCPSFMATREEKHSTRGRARLLFEMLQGDPLKGRWQNEGVKEALDLCLACKGCKSDCPVNVDMATYKAEFLSHYYEKHSRPISAYAFGLIDKWARLGSLAPELVNFFTQTPVLRSLAKRAVGMASERQVPKFATMTFKEWFARRGPHLVNTNAPSLILWADTFNNYFHPEVAVAATEVLEAAGYNVIVPLQHLCCGRPLYDYGMLSTAKKYLKRTIRALLPSIRSGVPIVGLEPSCVSVFKDELVNLFPNDLDARRLANQAMMLSEFLSKNVPEAIPTLDRKCIVHGHCHHKSVLGLEAEEQVLKKMGVDYELLESGCCGMAGSFGFEREHDRYQVSMAVGERVLLPAVRAAKNETLIITDGFSCRTQIEQATSKRPLHLAQVLQLGLKDRRK